DRPVLPLARLRDQRINPGRRRGDLLGALDLELGRKQHADHQQQEDERRDREHPALEPLHRAPVGRIMAAERSSAGVIVEFVRYLFSAALIAFALSACGGFAEFVKPGEPESAVLKSAGRPTASYPLGDGGKRLQYSGQPWNQSVWNIDLNSQGQVVRVQQMMSDAAFAHIRSGSDTRADVVREFGPPAYVWEFPMKSETAFMYRYF